MTFRIFRVSTDGVASPVYKQDAQAESASASAKEKELGAAEANSPEWHQLRERLRQQTTPKPARKSRLGR